MANLAFYTCNRFLTFSPRSSEYLLTLSTFNFTRSMASIRLGSYRCHVPDFFVVVGVFFFVFVYSGFIYWHTFDFPWTTVERKTKIGLFEIIYSIKVLKITKIPLSLKTEILRTGFCQCKKNRYHQREQLCSRFTSCLVTQRNLICFRRVASAKFRP